MLGRVLKRTASKLIRVNNPTCRYMNEGSLSKRKTGGGTRVWRLA